MCDGGWRKSQYSRIIVLSAFFNNIILVPASLWFKAPGAAASALITETVVTLAMAIMLYRRRGSDFLPTSQTSENRWQACRCSLAEGTKG